MKAFNLLAKGKYRQVLELPREELDKTVKRKKTLHIGGRTVSLGAGASLLDAAARISALSPSEDLLTLMEVLSKLGQKVQFSEGLKALRVAEDPQVIALVAKQLESFASQLSTLPSKTLVRVLEAVDIEKVQPKPEKLVALFREGLDWSQLKKALDTPEKVDAFFQKALSENAMEVFKAASKDPEFLENLSPESLVVFSAALGNFEVIEVGKLDSADLSKIYLKALETDPDWIIKNFRKSAVSKEVFRKALELGRAEILEKAVSSVSDLFAFHKDGGFAIKYSDDRYVPALRWLVEKFGALAGELVYSSLKSDSVPTPEDFERLEKILKNPGCLVKNNDFFSPDWSSDPEARLEWRESRRLAGHRGIYPSGVNDFSEFCPLSLLRSSKVLKNLLSSSLSLDFFRLVADADVSKFLENLKEAGQTLSSFGYSSRTFLEAFLLKKAKQETLTLEDLKALEEAGADWSMSPATAAQIFYKAPKELRDYLEKKGVVFEPHRLILKAVIEGDMEALERLAKDGVPWEFDISVLRLGKSQALEAFLACPKLWPEAREDAENLLLKTAETCKKKGWLTSSETDVFQAAANVYGTDWKTRELFGKLFPKAKEALKELKNRHRSLLEILVRLEPTLLTPQEVAEVVSNLADFKGREEDLEPLVDALKSAVAPESPELPYDLEEKPLESEKLKEFRDMIAKGLWFDSLLAKKASKKCRL